MSHPSPRAIVFELVVTQDITAGKSRTGSIHHRGSEFFL